MATDSLQPDSKACAAFRKRFALLVAGAQCPAVLVPIRDYYRVILGRSDSGVVTEPDAAQRSPQPPLSSTDEEIADLIANGLMATIALCRNAAAFGTGPAPPIEPLLTWLLKSADRLFRPLLDLSFRLAVGRLDGSCSDEIFRDIERMAAVIPTAKSSMALQPCHSFEKMLQRFDRSERRRKGVFFTPEQVASYVVRYVDMLLCDKFQLGNGIADESTWETVYSRVNPNTLRNAVEPQHLGNPFVMIADPSVGTGVFLIEVIKVAHRRMQRLWSERHISETVQRDVWDLYVESSLLPRLMGTDLMLGPLLHAHWNLAFTLLQTGYRFRNPTRLNLFLANSLAAPLSEAEISRLPGIHTAQHLEALREIESRRVTVFVGNPPYASLATTTNRWIADLLHGNHGGRGGERNYFGIDGKSIGEKKTWLHDDYVKFMRLLQYRVDQAGTGCMGIITNHGFLDNVTFRAMRYELLNQFDFVSLVDLHGNLKKRERTPAGGIDQNIFEIETGVSLNFFARVPGPRVKTTTWYDELWGTRTEKLDQFAQRDAAAPRLHEDTMDRPLVSMVQECDRKPLANESDATTGDIATSNTATSDTTTRFCHLHFAPRELHPTAPYFLFTPQNQQLAAEYDTGFSLADIMPVSSSAVVTARDRFVVSFDEASLNRRIQDFVDETYSDSELRSRFFSRTRSSRYLPGDTRSWKLADARHEVRRERLAGSNMIRRCLYRPFDWRYIYWSPHMVDWPRSKVSNVMASGNNLALIARRQSSPGQPCNFFWVSDAITLDGVIRSDNRGNETLFPLFVPDNCDNSPPGDGEGLERGNTDWKANFSSDFIRAMESSWGLRWLSHSTGNLIETIGPLDLFHYLYGFVSSNEYRQRYSGCMTLDYPRVFLADSVGLARLIIESGRALVDSHLLRDRRPGDSTTTAQSIQIKASSWEVESRYPKWIDGAIYFSQDCLTAVEEKVWAFRAGSHHLCHKWLADRRGRQLGPADAAHYDAILQAIRRSNHVTSNMDSEITSNGGWEKSFLKNS